MARNQQRLLVVEDDSDLLFIEMKTLEMAGYQVDGAYNVDAALRRLDHRRYDLVLTDLMLPQRNGNHLIAEASQRGIPCIAVTAYVWEQMAHAAQEIGCETLIAKPFKIEHFMQTVERVLDEAGKRNGNSYVGLGSCDAASN